MRKLTALLAFILVSVFAVQAQSQVKQFTVKSKILGVEKMYSVYLPDGYEKSGKNYPVLYLLHAKLKNLMLRKLCLTKISVGNHHTAVIHFKFQTPILTFQKLSSARVMAPQHTFA